MNLKLPEIRQNKSMKKVIKKILQTSVFDLYEAQRDKRIGRIQKKKQTEIINSYFADHKERKLQIGCGDNILSGWLNTDLNDRREHVAFLDAGEKFPFEDFTFDYVFSEHLFEHLTVSQQMIMMNETFRVLKKGGVMRIATPSLDFLFEIYSNPKKQLNETYIQWAVNSCSYLNEVSETIENSSQYHCYVVNNFFKAWGHQMIHNYASLSALAIQTGFSTIREVKVSESEYSDLLNIEKHGTVIPEQYNNLETMVVELIK